MTLAAAGAPAQQPFTLQQVLSAPYASELTAGPPLAGSGAQQADLFAWVEDTEGRSNLFVAGPHQPVRQLTHNSEDDGQQITHVAWAPDGSAIAYTFGAEAGADGEPANPAHLQHATPIQVMVQPLAPGAQPIVLGEGEAPLFAQDAHRVFFIRAGQIWSARLPPAEAPGQVVPRQLVFDRGSAGSLTLSPDGSLLAFVSTRGEIHEPSHSFIGVYNLRTRTLQFVAPSTESDFAPVFSADGRYLAWLREPFSDAPEFAPNRSSPNPWSIQLAETCAGSPGGSPSGSPGCAWSARTVFSPQPNVPGSVLPHMATGTPRLFFAGAHTLVFSSEADGWNHLYQLDWQTRKAPRLLTPGAFEVEDPALARSSAGGATTLFYAANECSASPKDADRRHLWKIEFTDAGASQPQRLTGGDGIEAHPSAGTSGFAGLYSDASTPAHPVFTGPDGVARPLHPEALPGAYPMAELIRPEQVLLPSTAGLTLHAQLFLPGRPGRSTLPSHSVAPGHSGPDAPRRPAVLFFHGGPRRQMLLGYPDMDYYSNVYAMNQYLASRGFLVLSVNYRCGIGYGLEFRQCLHSGADGAAEYSDVLAAVRYLRSRADVDPKRIGLWGGSYGGYLTELGLARNSDLLAAGVSFHGVYDWNLEDNAGDWLRGSFAQRDAIAARARASSPLGAIDRWRSPVLLIHGDDDPEVAYAQTPRLAEALRARHLPVQELIFPDEVHGFLLHRDWLAAYQATADFFERTLQP